MPAAGMPASRPFRPDEPATSAPARGPAIRKPTAPASSAMLYLRRRWIVPATNINSCRTSTMRPAISRRWASNSSGVPRPRSITSAVRPAARRRHRANQWMAGRLPSRRTAAALQPLTTASRRSRLEWPCRERRAQRLPRWATYSIALRSLSGTGEAAPEIANRGEFLGKHAIGRYCPGHVGGQAH